MKLSHLTLLAGTVLGLGLAMPAQADNIKTNTSANMSADTDIETTFYYYDQNNNNRMDQDEYLQYSYTTIDYNDDGYIDETEWNEYTTVWYEPVDLTYDNTQEFASYDADGDGYIEMNEYSEAYDYSPMYTAWDVDGDGYIEISEYNTMTTTYIDSDADGVYEWVTVQ